MTTLADQQQDLLEALFAWPPQAAWARLAPSFSGVGTSAQRGLQAYQRNGHVLAERALRAAYPVLAHLLGVANFEELARAHWHAQPPQCGDIGEWGGHLSEFIANSVQLREVPYLPDVARAEWALHRCALARDQAADLTTLALLTTEDPQTLTLSLAPGVTTLGSAWPLASLLLAHLKNSPSLAELAQQLQSGVAQDIVLWRAGFQPQLRQALPGEPVLLRALQDGVALEPAVGAATGLDFSEWLALAVQTGLVLGAKRCPNPPEDLPS
jgi:hypothetical protein